MHGLRNLREHVISHIDNVVDGIQADGFQALLQPLGRRLDGDVLEYQRGVPGAEHVVFDHHAQGCPAGEGCGRDRIDQLAAEDRGYLARHAVMTPQIGTMRQRFVVDLNDVVVAVRFNALRFSSLDGDELGQFARRRIELVHQVAQPVVGKFHRRLRTD